MICKGPVQLVFFMSLPMLYVFSAAYTYIGTYIFDWAKEVPFDLYYDVSSIYIKEAVLALMSASVFYVVGWVFAALIIPRKKSINYKESESGLFVFGGRTELFVIFFVAITPLFYAVGYGFASLVEREGYLDPSVDRSGLLLKIHMIMYPISAFSCAFIKRKYLGFWLMVLNFSVLFAASSRGAGLVLIIYGISMLIRRRSFTVRHFILMSLGAYIMIWMLSIRNNNVQGLSSNVLSLFSFSLDSNVFFLGLNYLTSFSVYGFAYTIQSLGVPLKEFLVSISPFPLSFHGGFSSISSLSLNANSPIPSVPTVYSMGVSVFFVFYFFLGIFAFLISFNLKMRKIIDLCVIAVFLLAVFMSIQYNLRGFSRLVYLAGFLSVIGRIGLRKYRYLSFRW